MSGTRDWDAATYNRVSGPQVEWARAVIDRLPLRGDETVLDAGCGTGRVARILLERLPRGRLVAVDAAPSMAEHARAALAGRAEVVCCDLLKLELPEAVDVVFSNAVFHWIADHPRLFTRLHDALKPGGRLVAQYGGEGNVARFHEIARAVGSEPPFAEQLADWRGAWNFTSPRQARTWLEGAGFVDVDAWLEPWPVRPAEPRDFIRTVCLGPHLARLPEPLRDAYVEAVAERIGDPLEIDYVRLNIFARRGS